MVHRFVEQEVERVKVLFDQKEGRLRSERDAAQQQLQEIKADRDVLEEQVGRSAQHATIASVVDSLLYTLLFTMLTDCLLVASDNDGAQQLSRVRQCQNGLSSV